MGNDPSPPITAHLAPRRGLRGSSCTQPEFQTTMMSETPNPGLLANFLLLFSAILISDRRSES